MKLVEIHFESIGSTNTYAKEHVGSFSPDQVTCITADEQTAGRGRFQRKWYSPKGVNLYVTFCFRLPKNALHLISLSQMMAASFASVLLDEGLHPKIKWPNDIRLNGKKLSGILCETSFHGEWVDVFLGIGVNVNMGTADLARIDQPATSLQAETGRSWDRAALLKKIQKKILHDLDLFKSKGFEPFHSLFENLLAFKGEIVSCSDGKRTWVGTCHSITNDGQLNIYSSDKSMHTVLSGEISK
jgi:BirA family biotin operon repressor/biotin-[acetyl-CoA-carboxylase] ligase